MPAADKRARKKENARAAREQREAAARRRKRMRSSLTVGVVVALFVGVIVLLNVTGSSKKKAASVNLPAGCVTTVPKAGTKPTFKSEPNLQIDVTKHYTAHVSTTCGTFDISLAPDVAPHTVNSFVFLARRHFYDGLKFHRLVRDFVIQGGDPGNRFHGPGYQLRTEPPTNGYGRWSVAMANAGPGTTGSQFFVAVSQNGAKKLGGPPYLYSELGLVTRGTDVIQKLMTFAPADPNGGVPTRPLYIFKITISES
jgi:cyclophilin family peptidyl-prolyl cis-trans isomerase